MINKKILILKSEPLSEQQSIQLINKGYQPVHINLLKFQYHEFQLDNHYDYIFLNSPNGAVSLINNLKNTQFDYLYVVGEQSKKKLQEYQQKITVFKNQSELIDAALALQKSNILYIIGNLSEIDERLKQQHNLTIKLGYETIPNDEINITDISDVNTIVYYSKSNYDFFQNHIHLLKNAVQSIFWGPKASLSSNDEIKIILQNPTFEDLLNVL
ncbi:hypothetical protein pb186bvf_004833 [Paramecium bursaria]